MPIIIIPHYHRGSDNNSDLSDTGLIILLSILIPFMILLILCIFRKCIYKFCYNKFACCCKKQKQQIQLEKEREIQNQLNERIIYTAQIKNISIEEACMLKKSELHPYELIPIRYNDEQNKIHDEMLNKLINVQNKETII